MKFTSNNAKNTIKHLGMFDIEEIELGEKLGSGAFSHVYEVKSFQHCTSERNCKIKCSHQQAREQMTQSAEDGGRYAIKFLKKMLLKGNKYQFGIAARNLEEEARVLSSLDHPNILKIRGWAANGFNAYFDTKRHDGYFILMDRLEKTLSKRIEEWKSLAFPYKELRKKLLLEQLMIAHDIAHALEYLHEKGYIFRDLKPDNIGLDTDNNGKLFDFGLARKMPRGGDMDKQFQMSGKIGTRRYMAPEVCQNKPYNAKADVHSFAYVLWEMLALQKPHATLSNVMYRNSVVENGVRPNMDPSWPSRIQKLLVRSWDPSVSQRPTMKAIRTILEIEITELQQEEATRSFRTNLGEMTEEQILVGPRAA
mmetsp:Transcript_17088/g.39510  ORF Transcript_17088/g.39510 Transcript_17088/m.39510 type:complete len:366 (+) Transcript_17088:46-1143(+)